MSIAISKELRLARAEAQAAQQRAALSEVQGTASIAFVVMAEAGTLDDTTINEHAAVFAPWAEGVAYTVGQLRTYGEGEDRRLYRCVQAHTSQADWTPPATPALWAATSDPSEEWPAWSAPIGAHDAYALGDKVSHNGQHWISTVNANVWEPGVYGWEAQPTGGNE